MRFVVPYGNHAIPRIGINSTTYSVRHAQENFRFTAVESTAKVIAQHAGYVRRRYGPGFRGTGKADVSGMLSCRYVSRKDFFFSDRRNKSHVHIRIKKVFVLGKNLLLFCE